MTVLQGRGGEAGPLLAESRELFEQLMEKPWLERLARVQVGVPMEVPAG